MSAVFFFFCTGCASHTWVTLWCAFVVTMEFNAEEFVTHPTLEEFHSYTKKHLISLASFLEKLNSCLYCLKRVFW